jgi:hypothetical protein
MPIGFFFALAHTPARTLSPIPGSPAPYNFSRTARRNALTPADARVARAAGHAFRCAQERERAEKESRRRKRMSADDVLLFHARRCVSDLEAVKEAF